MLSSPSIVELTSLLAHGAQNSPSALIRSNAKTVPPFSCAPEKWHLRAGKGFLMEPQG